ncbi:MAG: MFS transporter [Gammaproteobacteria bacterium CG_4_10_14_0_8_um_filter_38_16]|nr:MAG: MFS transporter [Gammaproteobacteria bacterium CG_4_10_14_0_8_um_filter_38_16]PJA03711.1 MAG: MFS transporter [Gammaproteobacteria bacterium CG_4_10_14_0_2_um_filter_38_22]PJB10877.1 MAG: MFS transporter [Gammaproteobacteria bacterium CG_4_9_14_3_um_filter_38_9]
MSHFHQRLQLLKRPAFLSYMIGFFCAAFGNGMGYIAMSWIVVTRHSNVTAMAILMACFWGPNVILGPFMGVLADRLSRKGMMLISNFVRAVIFIIFSIYLRNHFNVNTVYIMMLCIGVSFSAFFSCVFAFMRELVPEKDLMHANSTIDIIYEAGNMIGMGLAGLLIAWTSEQTAILINGIAFLIATASLFFIPQKALLHGGKRETKKIKLFQDFQDGLTYLFANKKLIVLSVVQLLIFMTFLTTPLLLVPFSKTVLHATVGQFGMIEAFASIGIVIGGIFMPWISEQFGFWRVLLFFSFVLCVIFMVFGYNHLIPIAAFLYFAIGFSGAIWPLIITKAQAITAIDFQGRVQSTFNSVSGTMMLIFYFTIGWIGNHFAVKHLYWLEVIISLLAICFLIYAKKNDASQKRVSTM